MGRSSQRRILKDIHEGQRKAYEAVICQNYKSIYRFLVYLTDDVSIAEDITQETFTSAWESIRSFKERASIGTWLHKIAYHKFIDSKRKLECTAEMMHKLEGNHRNITTSVNPLHQLAADESLRFLYDGIRSLEPVDRTVIVLHYVQELSFREMAKVLDEPRGTVKWRTNKALKRLRTILTGRV